MRHLKRSLRSGDKALKNSGSKSKWPPLFGTRKKERKFVVTKIRKIRTTSSFTVAILRVVLRIKSKFMYSITGFRMEHLSDPVSSRDICGTIRVTGGSAVPINVI